MKSSIVLTTIAIGLLLLVGGYLWTTLFPATSNWTEEKAARLAQVKTRLNDLGYLLNRPANASGPKRAALEAELEKLTAENQELNATFTKANDRPQLISKFMKRSGIAIAVVGLVGWYAINQSR